jgi:hypothetical protein
VLKLLEDRTLPSTLSFTAGTLTYQAAAGETNILSLSFSGGTYTFSDSGTTAGNTPITITDNTGIPGTTGGGTGTVTVPGGSVTAVVINAGDQNDTINVLSTQSGVPTSVNDGPGNDTFAVGDASNTLAGLAGAVTFNASGGTDSLTVNDQGTTAAVTYTVSGAGVTATSAGAGITYNSAVGSLTLNGAGGGNTVTVTGTIAGTTTVNSGAGSDTVYDLATTGSLAVNGVAGQDVVQLGSSSPSFGGTLANLNGSVSVTNAGGATVLHVDDSGDSTAKTATLKDGSITGLAPATISWTPTATSTGGVTNLDVRGGSGGNTFTVANTSAFYGSTGLLSGSGTVTDQVNVLGTTGQLFVIDNNGHANIVLGSSAPDSGGTVAAIKGGVYATAGQTGSASLYVDDSGDTSPQSATMKDGSLSGLAPGLIQWVPSQNAIGGVTYLRVDGGSGGNTFTVVNSSNMSGHTYLNTGPGNDTVNVQGEQGYLYIDGVAGTDTVTVGSTAPAIGGTLANIQGELTVLNTGGSTALVVGDQGDPFPKTVDLENGYLGGLAPGVVAWTPSATATGGVTSAHIYGGAGDTYEVRSTGLLYNGTVLDSGLANDTVNVLGTTGALTVNGDGGTTMVQIGSNSPYLTGSLANILGSVTVSASDGVAYLTVDDSQDTTGHTATLTDHSLIGPGPAPIQWSPAPPGGSGVSTVNIFASSGGNTFTVDIAAQLANGIFLDCGSGNDTVTVAASQGNVTLDGENGNDTVSVTAPTVLGSLTVQNSLGQTALTVDDSADTAARTATLTSSTLTGLAPGTISYAGGQVSSLTVDGGGHGNAFNVQGTPTGTAVTINAGAGNDTVNVGNASNLLDGIQGALTVNGQAGTDTLNLLDQGQSTGQSYTLGATAVTRGGIAPISYNDIEALVLKAGSGNDSVAVTSLPTFPTTVNGGGGTNTLTGPNANATWNITRANGGMLGKVRFAGFQDLVGGSGVDTFKFGTAGKVSSIDAGARRPARAIGSTIPPFRAPAR